MFKRKLKVKRKNNFSFSICIKTDIVFEPVLCLYTACYCDIIEIVNRNNHYILTVQDFRCGKTYKHVFELYKDDYFKLIRYYDKWKRAKNK